MRNFRRLAMVVVLGAALSVVSSGRVWIEVAVSDETQPLTTMTFTGTELVSTAHALMLCVIVLVLGMALAKGIIRKILAVIAAVVAILSIVEIVRFLDNTGPAISELVATALGRELVQSSVTLSTLPYLSILGLLVATAGSLLISLLEAPGTGLSTKYERPTGTQANQSGAEESEHAINPWAALDAGIDPTL